MSASSSRAALSPGFLSFEADLFKVSTGLAGAILESRREPPGFCKFIEEPGFCNPEEGVTMPLFQVLQ
jgi:hypothetical protein